MMKVPYQDWLMNYYCTIEECFTEEDREVIPFEKVDDYDIKEELTLIAKKLIQMTANYAYGQANFYKLMGFHFEPEVKFENDRVTISFSIKGIERRTYNLIKEIAFRKKVWRALNRGRTPKNGRMATPLAKKEEEEEIMELVEQLLQGKVKLSDVFPKPS